MGARVGIPRTLAYYTYYPFWQALLTGLGATCVVSRPTTKATLDAGIETAVSEACVPIKLFFGHVQELIDEWRAGRIDMLFVPRLVSWDKKTVFCPKFLGLPDMVRCTWRELPPLIAPRIDRRKRPFPLLRVADEVRTLLGAPRSKLLPALRKAFSAQRGHARRLAANWDASRSIVTARGREDGAAGQERAAHRAQPVRLAVLAYPYLIYDEYVSLGILPKLREMGVEVVTAEALEHRHPGPVRRWSKQPFWTYSSMVARAGVYALDPQSDIDGVIHVTAFSCGPDAIVDKLLELEAKRPGAKPFLALGLDEQTGEAGALTRLEAFVDMLRRKQALAEAAATPGGPVTGRAQ